MFKKLMLVASLTALSSVANAAEIIGISCFTQNNVATVSVEVNFGDTDYGTWFHVYAKDSNGNYDGFDETLSFWDFNHVFEYKFKKLNGVIVEYNVYSPLMNYNVTKRDCN